MILLGVKFSFHWGFWARPLILSARQPTMTVPPPTAFVGALARGLAELLRARGVWVPEYRRAEGRYHVPLALGLGRCVERVYFRLIRGGVSAAVDKTRVFQGPYIRLENLGNPAQRFAVRDLGKAYAPGAEAEFAALIEPGGSGLKSRPSHPPGSSGCRRRGPTGHRSIPHIGRRWLLSSIYQLNSTCRPNIG